MQDRMFKGHPEYIPRTPEELAKFVRAYSVMYSLVCYRESNSVPCHS